MLSKSSRIRLIKVVKFTFGLILITFLCLTSNAQPKSRDNNSTISTQGIGPDPLDPEAVDPDPVPLSGIEVLLLTGLSFGAYSKFRKRKE